MNILGPEIKPPEWISDARFYYSKIDTDKRYSVRVMKPPDEGEANDKNPGSLYMYLAASFREVRVQDAAGNEQGIIRPRGPGFGYAMRRSGRVIWTVSNRSVVMRRHALEFAGAGTWDVRTPFYWWMHIVCREGGQTRALGKVGSRKWLWGLWIEPGRDSNDVLSALAFMHRRWLRL
jgi:hypothetical protein